MYELMWLVIGWGIGIINVHILELISHLLGTIWHLVTRRSLDEHDSVLYAIDRACKIDLVRQFFRISTTHA